MMITQINIKLFSFLSSYRMYLTFAALESILNVAMSYKLSSLDESELKSIMQFYSKCNNLLF